MRFDELASKAGETAARVGGQAHRPPFGELLTAHRRLSFAAWSAAAVVVAAVVVGAVLTWPMSGSQAPVAASDSTTTTVPLTSTSSTPAAWPDTCPVTVVGENAFTPQSEAPEPLLPHYESVWYGTPELWTMISPDGEQGLLRWLQGEKSFWWSESYELVNELEPNLTVTAEHLDGTAPSVQVGAPGTNGSHPVLGDFMLVGIELPASGCWEVTGEYKGASLSYVMWVPDQSED